MKELEVRIIDIDVDNIRKRLSELNTVKVKQENQINRIYDFPDRRLLNHKGYARIRTIDDKLNNRIIHFMTTKELISQEKYKIMNEHEIEISSSEDGEAIFKALGLEHVQSIKSTGKAINIKTLW